MTNGRTVREPYAADRLKQLINRQGRKENEQYDSIFIFRYRRYEKFSNQT